MSNIRNVIGIKGLNPSLTNTIPSPPRFLPADVGEIALDGRGVLLR
jgi:hypothetical protein